MSKIRLMIVDDHEIVRLGMHALFELESDISVVGEASSGAEAIAKVSVFDPHVILMDIVMPNTDGIEACRDIKTLHPDIHILMITSHDTERAEEDSLLAGATGYLVKNSSRAELLKAVRAAARGQRLIDQNSSRQAMSRIMALTHSTTHDPAEELTEREREVLSLVALGYTNKQIADTLVVSEKTARNHVSHILEKLGLSRRSQAAAFAATHRISYKGDTPNTSGSDHASASSSPYTIQNTQLPHSQK